MSHSWPLEGYYLGWANGADLSLVEAARVAKAEHRIEECIRRGKSEAGLGDYQVRNWCGWHHHLTLSLVAACSSSRKRGGEKIQTPALKLPRVRDLIACMREDYLNCNRPTHVQRRTTWWLRPSERARFYRYRKLKLLQPLKNQLRI